MFKRILHAPYIQIPCFNFALCINVLYTTNFLSVSMPAHTNSDRVVSIMTVLTTLKMTKYEPLSFWLDIEFWFTCVWCTTFGRSGNIVKVKIVGYWSICVQFTHNFSYHYSSLSRLSHFNHIMLLSVQECFFYKIKTF